MPQHFNGNFYDADEAFFAHWPLKQTGFFYVLQVMEGACGLAADDRSMKTSEEGDPRSDSGAAGSPVKRAPKVWGSRPPSSESSPRPGVDPCGSASTTQSPLSVPATDPGSRETDSGRACDARAARPAKADSRPARRKEEASRYSTQTPSGFHLFGPSTTNGHGTARPATGLKNGERAVTEKTGESSDDMQPSSSETARCKGVEVSATSRLKANSPPCSESSGKGNGNGRPSDDTPTTSHLKGFVVEGDALCGSEEEKRNGNTKVAGAAPNGRGAVESGWMSQARVPGETMERSGASAGRIPDKDQAKRVAQEESQPSPKAAFSKADVAEARESVPTKEYRTLPSPNQPGRQSVSPESSRVERKTANGALSDAARNSDKAGVAQTERSGKGPITSARTGAVARTAPHDGSPCSVIAPGSDSQDGAACQPQPVDCVWGSAERVMRMTGRGRRRVLEDEQTKSTPWGEPIEHESLGDTTDIALAAVSYANAVVEGGAVGSLTSSAVAGPESKDARGQTRPAPSRTCGESSTSIAIGNANAGPSGHGDGDTMVSADAAVAFTTTQPASRSSSNERTTRKVAEVSKAAVPMADASRALSSNGVRRTTRGEKCSRASGHHDDMMNAMCMICLEKLSDAAAGGRAKHLGIIDSCSHRYCYTVSHIAFGCRKTIVVVNVVG